MNLIPYWPWWPRRWHDKAVEPDAADMGTAFGLDASFDEPDPGPGERPADPRSRRVSSRTGLPLAD